jgi:hypothetical protein
MSFIDIIQKMNEQINKANQPIQYDPLPETNIYHVEKHFQHKGKKQAIPFLLVLLIAFGVTLGIYIIIEGVPDFDYYIQEVDNFVDESEY